MLSLNKVQLAGNLTRSPEVKVIANDRAVCSFGMALNHRWTDKATGEKKEDTTFVEVVAWGKLADLVGQYLQKGSPCYVEGRLTQDTWEDKEGKKQSKTKVTADTVQFLGTKPREDSDPRPSTAPVARPHAKPVHRSATPAVPYDDQPPFSPDHALHLI